MKRLFILLGQVLLVATAQADSMSTIQLQNRPAEEVIPIVKPMLGANDVITGEGFNIFLRSSPETLARVRQMIDVLDIRAKVMLVSVFQGSERDLGALGIRANIQFETGNASVDIGNENANNAAGGSITVGTNSGSASISGINKQESLRDIPIHQVRVTEGTEAYIQTGEQIPYFLGATPIRPGRAAGGVEYTDAMTGFYVLPRLRGDNVILEISPFKSSQSNTGDDNINTLSAGTTITGRVGEWLLIGGVTEQVERTESGIGTTTTTQGGENTGIWVRADLVQ